MTSGSISTPYFELMGRALLQAKQAAEKGEVPVGAVLTDPAGSVVAEGHNLTITTSDPTAHAEMVVIRAANSGSTAGRLEGYTLVSTLEPCPMCAGAIVLARLAKVVYGAADPKAGACWSLYNIPQDERLNHCCELQAGVRAEECAQILSGFFAKHRASVPTETT